MRIAVLISGTGSNLKALIDHQSTAHYQIGCVLSNRPEAKGIVFAQQAGIATEILDHTHFESRDAFDQEMISALSRHQIDAIVLAGFMRILTPNFVNHYLGKMLNIHPSLLPKYPGLNTHKRALEANDAEHGISIHFVTSELDGGPVICQSKFNITENDTVESLQKKAHQYEHKAYWQVVEWLATGDIALKNGQAWFNNQPLNQPLQLSPTSDPL
ncbi:phosphoribosylglycinamide formyltransferase [Hydrogenovibrio sp. SC-1]|nr:phosphoribosylglycinamide formyltransferase [Hydrogenovibrio sp. SC-1]